MSVVFGLVGLAIGFLWLRGFSARIRRDPRFQPVALRRIAGGGSPVRFSGPGHA
jgi:positive regulator of sigma E activity